MTELRTLFIVINAISFCY